MKNTFFLCLVLASLAVFALATFEENFDDAPEETEDAGQWTTYETNVDLSTGLNLTSPAISYNKDIEITEDIHKNQLFIRTLGWPKHYPTRYIHKWIFSTRPGYLIKITFNKIFDVEIHDKKGSCFDYVEIDDYGYWNKFCGYNRPEAYVSKNNKGFYLTFKSDSRSVGRGFFATVEQVKQTAAEKPRVELIRKDGREFVGKINVNPGTFSAYVHVKGGIDRAYSWTFACKLTKKNTFDESDETVFTSAVLDDTVVSMSAERHSRYYTFPLFQLHHLTKGKDMNCYLSARYGHDVFRSKRYDFHVL